MRPSRSIGKNQRYILGAYIATVRSICRANPALDPTGDLKLFADILCRFIAATFRQNGYFGEIAWRARRSPGEDHILHACATHRLGAALAHHPTYGLKQVRLAATIWADNTGQPALDPEFSRLNKAFEADEFQLLYAQRGNPAAVVWMSWPPRAIFSVRRPRPACP